MLDAQLQRSATKEAVDAWEKALGSIRLKETAQNPRSIFLPLRGDLLEHSRVRAHIRFEVRDPNQQESPFRKLLVQRQKNDFPIDESCHGLDAHYLA